MVIIFFVLILCLIIPFNSKYNRNEITINNFFNSSNSTIEKCLDSMDNEFKDVLTCCLWTIKEKPDDAKLYLENKSVILIGFLKIYTFSDRKAFLKPIVNLIEDIFLNKSNPILNETFELIKNPNSSTIVDYIIQIINNNEEIFTILNNIFNVPGVKELFNYALARYRDNIIDILEAIFTGKKYINLFHMLKEYLSKNLDMLYELLYELIQKLNERKEFANALKNFLINNTNNNTVELLKETQIIFLNKTIVKEYLNVVTSVNEGVLNIIEQIFLDSSLVNFTFSLLNNETYIEKLLDIIINLDDKNYVNENIPKFANFLLDNKKKNLKFFLNITETIGKNLVKKESFNKMIGVKLGKKIKEIIFENNTIFSYINSKCINLFEKTLFNGIADDTFDSDELTLFYIKKIIIETTKNKNDFLTYENCLSSKYNFNYSKENKIKPIFVIGITDDIYNKSKLKNSILHEKYKYLQSLCLPYGIDNETKKDLCTIEDYNNITKIFSELAYNMNTSSVDTLILNDENIQIKSLDYFYLSLSFIIMVFPLLIKFFLAIYKIIIQKRQDNNGEIINKLIINEKGNKSNLTKENEIISGKNENMHFKFPKWYQILNDYFDIMKNCGELFNFSKNESNFNNFNGITYIKGILGISMILNLFGKTFFILSNLPHKVLATYKFYKAVVNPIYIIIFFGFRYAPRLIFSCSGYTLMYKFLSFIERDPSFYFLKFLLLHSYKYILLI